VGLWSASSRSTSSSYSICSSRLLALAPNFGTLMVAGATPAGLGFLRRRHLTEAAPPYSSLLLPLHCRALACTCARDPPLHRDCQASLRSGLTVVAPSSWSSWSSLLTTRTTPCYSTASPSICVCRMVVSCNPGVPSNPLTSDAAAAMAQVMVFWWCCGWCRAAGVVMPLYWSSLHPQRR
jgi:hypothetical protein